MCNYQHPPRKLYSEFSTAYSSCPSSTRPQPTQPGKQTNELYALSVELVSQLHTTAANTNRQTGNRAVRTQRTARVPAPHDRSQHKQANELYALSVHLVSQLHMTAANTTRQTPHAVLYSLFS